MTASYFSKGKSIMAVAPVNSVALSETLDESKFISFPNSAFQLYQMFEPAGDQPAAIAKLVEGIDDGLFFQTLLGVTGSGKTYTMANVIARTGRPAIIFAPNKTLAAQLYSEFREFFPRNAVEYFVSYYDYYQPEAYVPQRDLFIEKDSAINEHIEQMRLSCTKSLMERRDVIIVATVSAIYGIGNPSEYHKMILTLRTKDKVSQRDVIARLIQMQYILHLNQAGDHIALTDFVFRTQSQDHFMVLAGITNTIDRRNGGDDNDVATLHQ